MQVEKKIMKDAWEEVTEVIPLILIWRKHTFVHLQKEKGAPIIRVLETRKTREKIQFRWKMITSTRCLNGQ
jgi:hypothetical protein